MYRFRFWLLLLFWFWCSVFEKSPVWQIGEVGDCHCMLLWYWLFFCVTLYFFVGFYLQQNALLDKKGLRWFFRGELLQHSSLMAGHQYKIANYFAANSFSLSAAWNWWKYKNTQINKYKYIYVISTKFANYFAANSFLPSAAYIRRNCISWS